MATQAKRQSHSSESTPLIKDENPRGEENSTWATAKLILLSSAGIFADGWDIQVLNLALAIISQLHPVSMTTEAKSFAASMTFAGIIIGMLFFGVVADMIGRKFASITTAVLTVIGVLGSSGVSESSPFGLAMSFGVWRFFAGLGIGGEYPLSATLTKEAMQTLSLNRVQLLVVTAAMMNVGGSCQAVLVWTMIGSGMSLDMTWRLAVAAGALPSILVIILRCQMEEPQLPSGESRQASNYIQNVFRNIGLSRPVLLASCLCWALYNFSSFGQLTFASSFCNHLLGEEDDNRTERLDRNAKFALTLGLGYIIGQVGSSFLVKKFSLPLLQALGFLVFGLTMFMSAWSFSQEDQGGIASAVLFFGGCTINGLLGVTTYLIPTESFSAAARGTAVGLAAASGKFGALLGTALFPFLQHGVGFVPIMMISGLLAIVGMLVTLHLLPQACEPWQGKAREQSNLQV